MTVGIGCLVESGAVVLVDSARVHYSPDGSVETRIGDDKMMFAEGLGGEDVRLVVIHSGGSPTQRQPLALPRDFGEFDIATEHAWEALTSGEWADFVPPERRSPHAVIVAGSRHGEPVRLVRRGTDAPDSVADFGSMFGIGLASGIWQPPRPLQTMPDAIAASLELFTELMRAAPREEKAHLVGWPATMAVVTPESIQTYSFSETHHQCRF